MKTGHIRGSWAESAVLGSVCGWQTKKNTTKHAVGTHVLHTSVARNHECMGKYVEGNSDDGTKVLALR